MKRLIDDMDAAAMKLSWARWSKGIDAWCEEMCKPITEWYNKLDPDDDDTWVLCFTSDVSAEGRRRVAWIVSYREGELYPYVCVGSGRSKYATPVDPNIRYKGDKQ
jgi:hypothetical protein